jgi:hypothetical protein
MRPYADYGQSSVPRNFPMNLKKAGWPLTGPRLSSLMWFQVSDVRRGLLHRDQKLNNPNQVDKSPDQYDPFMIILGLQAFFEKVLKLFYNDFDGIPYFFAHTNLLATVPGTRSCDR